MVLGRMVLARLAIVICVFRELELNAAAFVKNVR